MGTKAVRRRGLADALFTPVQQRVLALIFGQPERAFQSAEVIRLARGGIGAVHRQLERLSNAELVHVTRSGNQKYYQANRNSPVFADLHGLVVKTVGLVDPIRRSLAKWASQIEAAFVYGSVAKGTDRSHSDIDLMVLTDSVTYADIYGALAAVETTLGRRINPTVMTRDEWRLKEQTASTFAARVSEGPRLFIIGSPDGLP